MGLRSAIRGFARRALEISEATLGYDPKEPGRRVAGVRLTRQEVEAIPAYWAGVRQIAETISMMPIEVKLLNGNPASENHAMIEFLRKPAPVRRRNAWLRMVLVHLLIYGNSPHWIEQDQMGRATRLIPLDPATTRVIRRRNISGPDDEDSLVVRTREKGVPRDLDFKDVLWIAGIGFNGITGYSPLHQFRNSFALMIAVTRYASSFFAKHGRPFGILTAPGGMDNEELKEVQDTWESRYNPDYVEGDAGGTAVLPGPIDNEGWIFAPVSSTPEEAQFIETRAFNVQEVARVLKIPATKLFDMSNSTYNNIGEESISFRDQTILPWTAVLQDALNTLGERHTPPVEVEFNLARLTAGTFLERMQAYDIGIGNGMMLRNEARAAEGWPEIPGLDDDPEPEPPPQIIMPPGTEDPNDDPENPENQN